MADLARLPGDCIFGAKTPADLAELEGVNEISTNSRSSESWTVNSLPTLAAYHKYCEDQYAEHKYVTFSPPRIGADRSLDQGALLHVWLREYAAELLGKNKKQVTPGELAGMKRTAKLRFNAQHPDCKKWMIFVIVCPMTGSTKPDCTSSKSWKRGEMYMFLTWLQMTAANDGIVLESKGEYAKLQRKEAEV